MNEDMYVFELVCAHLTLCETDSKLHQILAFQVIKDLGNNSLKKSLKAQTCHDFCSYDECM